MVGKAHHRVGQPVRGRIASHGSTAAGSDIKIQRGIFPGSVSSFGRILSPEYLVPIRSLRIYQVSQQKTQAPGELFRVGIAHLRRT